jgi:hypothetical protein
LIVGEEIKKNIKKMTEDTEARVARSILRWKYRREGKPTPSDQQLENDSTQVARQAHKVIARRGRNVWNELKRVYLERSKEQED